MAYSSILGADVAPAQPSGREADLLGPSDNSDSGSDAIGTREAHADSDSRGTGENAAAVPSDMDQREGGDILPDRIVNLGDADAPATDPDALELTDLDAQEDDLAGDEGDTEEGR